jgi:hypothetical protein
MKHYPRWIGILRRILLWLGIGATLVAAAVVEEDMRGERAWRSYKAAKAASTEPLDYAYYAPVRVPDGENLFMAPILRQFFEPGGKTWKIWSEFSHRSKDPVEVWSYFGQWERGQRADFDGAYRKLKHLDARAPLPDRRIEAELVLAQFDAVKADLNAVDEAARQRPRSQIEFMPDGSFVPNSFGVLREIPSLLSWRATTEIELGQADAAYRDLYASLRVVRGAMSLPSVLHVTIGSIMAVRSLQPLWEGLQKDTLSGAQLNELQDLLATFRPLGNLTTALAAHRAAIVLLDQPLPGPKWMPEGWRKLSVINYLEANSTWNSTLFDPSGARVFIPAIAKLHDFSEEQNKSNSPFGWYLRSRGLQPRLVFNIACGQNAYVLGATACALERFKKTVGRYPASLPELVPAYLPSLPVDVIDGKPLRYFLTDDGHFKLYSIGSNGFDDHGAYPSGTKGVFPWSSDWPGLGDGDWQWPSTPTN